MKKILLVILVLFSTTVFAQEGAQQFENFNLQGYEEGGAKAWDVKGEKADMQGDTVLMNNVDANRYGKEQVNLKADKGTIDKTSGNIHLEQNVVITGKEGAQLTTDYLDWDKNKDLVKTEADVTLTDAKQGMKATGTGLEAKPGLKTAELKEDVTVTVTPQKSDVQTVTITCDGPMEVDQKTNKATFNVNVVAIEGDRTLKADKMEVYFDIAKSTISKAVCTGNVEIIQGDNTTFSDMATYNGVNQTLTLTGRPKLIMVTGEGGIMPKMDKAN